MRIERYGDSQAIVCGLGRADVMLQLGRKQHTLVRFELDRKMTQAKSLRHLDEYRRIRIEIGKTPSIASPIVCLLAGAIHAGPRMQGVVVPAEVTVAARDVERGLARPRRALR